MSIIARLLGKNHQPHGFILLHFFMAPFSSHPACPSNSFPCKDNKKCVPRELLCDHHSDCDDGSDELDCSKFWSSCLLLICTIFQPECSSVVIKDMLLDLAACILCVPCKPYHMTRVSQCAPSQCVLLYHHPVCVLCRLVVCILPYRVISTAVSCNVILNILIMFHI